MELLEELEIAMKAVAQDAIPLEKVEKDTDRDFYLDAQEAKDYGLIDEVIKTKTWIDWGSVAVSLSTTPWREFFVLLFVL